MVNLLEKDDAKTSSFFDGFCWVMLNDRSLRSREKEFAKLIF